MKNDLEKPITLKSAGKKKAAGETLSVQEKKLISQEPKQEKLAVIEKKKRLKKSVTKKEEYHGENDSTIFTGDTTNQVFDSYDEQPSIDDMTLSHILGRIEKNKEPIPSPDIDEKKKLLEMFRTDVPSEIDAIIAREESAQIASFAAPELNTNHWDHFQDREEETFHAEKFAHNEKSPKGRWYENIKPSTQNPLAAGIERGRKIASEKVEHDYGTDFYIAAHKDGQTSVHTESQIHHPSEKILRDSKKEKLEKKKGFLDKIKKWFIKDHHLLESALYDQNRQEIDRMLDHNVELAGQDYNASLLHDQADYDAKPRSASPAPHEAGTGNEKSLDFNRERGNL